MKHQSSGASVSRWWHNMPHTGSLWRACSLCPLSWGKSQLTQTKYPRKFILPIKSTLEGNFYCFHSALPLRGTSNYTSLDTLSFSGSLLKWQKALKDPRVEVQRDRPSPQDGSVISCLPEQHPWGTVGGCDTKRYENIGGPITGRQMKVSPQQPTTWLHRKQPEPNKAVLHRSWESWLIAERWTDPPNPLLLSDAS